MLFSRLFCSSTPHDGPRGSQDHPKTADWAPPKKTHQNGRGPPQDGPRGAQDGARMPQAGQENDTKI
eukprot:4706311-Pyramimonas_sp.AAC.1